MKAVSKYVERLEGGFDVYVDSKKRKIRHEVALAEAVDLLPTKEEFQELDAEENRLDAKWRRLFSQKRELGMEDVSLRER